MTSPSSQRVLNEDGDLIEIETFWAEFLFHFILPHTTKEKMKKTIARRPRGICVVYVRWAFSVIDGFHSDVINCKVKLARVYGFLFVLC